MTITIKAVVRRFGLKLIELLNLIEKDDSEHSTFYDTHKEIILSEINGILDSNSFNSLLPIFSIQ